MPIFGMKIQKEMEHSKLIELLKTLNGNEMRRLGEFVRSPYFNKNEEVTALYDYLASVGSGFPAVKIQKEKVFSKLFPGQKFDARKMGYLMNYLHQAVEEFLLVEYYRNEDVIRHYHAMQVFSFRKLEKHYLHFQRKLRRSLDVESTSGSRHFYTRYLLERAAAEHFSLQKVRRADPSLQAAADALDDHYLLQKLKYACEMLSRQTIFRTEYEPRNLTELNQILQNRDDLPPVISLFHLILLLFLEPREEWYFDRFLQLFREHRERIEREERRDLYIYSINFCGMRIPQGEDRFIPLALELYQAGIEDGSLFEGNHLSHWTYTNVVKLSLHLQRYAWTEQFIESYRDALEPGFRDDAMHYNLAELFYQKEDYHKVLDNLQQLHFSDLHYHLGSRILLIKTYYALEELEALESQLAAFTAFLRRNGEVSATFRKSCLNFCRLLQQILRRQPGQRSGLRRLVSTAQPLIQREWLQEILD